MENVSGRWALITGASRGIGLQIAKFLASKGCNLILHSRSINNMIELKKELELFNIQVYLVEAELSDLNQVKNLLNEIDCLNVVVDYVINNAGIQVGYRVDYLNTPIEDYDQSFKVNTIAPMMITYHFLPKMIENGYGRIINTTSGIKNEPQQAGYSASKAALDKVTIDLAKTINGTNVMINLFDPGWCRTDLGGSSAPNDVMSTLPGSVLGLFSSDLISGRIIKGQEYSHLSLEEALVSLKNK